MCGIINAMNNQDEAVKVVVALDGFASWPDMFCYHGAKWSVCRLPVTEIGHTDIERIEEST